MRYSTVQTFLTAAIVLALTSSAPAGQPSQADIELCNRKAAEVKLRTAKGAHETPPPAEPHRHDAASTPAGDGAVIGMAPIGESDGVYRQAYTSCIHQREQ